MIPPGAKRSGMDSHSSSRSDYGIIAIAMIPPGAKRSGIDSHSSSRSDYGIIGMETVWYYGLQNGKTQKRLKLDILSELM